MVREVCDVLAIQRVSDAMADLNTDKTRVGEFRFRKDGGRANKMVNEAGLYALVMRSNKPNAKAFQKWTPVGWSLARSCPRSARAALGNSYINRTDAGLNPGRNLTRCPASYGSPPSSPSNALRMARVVTRNTTGVPP